MSRRASALSETARPLQPHAIDEHLHYLLVLFRRSDFGRKQLQLPAFTLLVEHFDGFQPARLRRTVQLTQIAQSALPRTRRRARRLHQRKILVRLAVLHAQMRTQKHLRAS
jgi:hypothetical protein